jgi:FkbM family methyltransferase
MSNKVLVNTKYGEIYVMKNDIIGMEILSGKYHEEEIVCMLSRYTRGGVVLDVGSNIGSTSLGLLSLDKDCKIYSFEPQLYLAEMQMETVAKNKYLNRVTLYNTAVGNKCKKGITLSGNFNMIDSLEGVEREIKYDDSQVRNYGGVNIGDGGEKVDMVSLDYILKKDELGEVSLIKIDVEGAESLVIYGGRELIKKYKPVIFYEDNWKKITDEMALVLNLSEEERKFDISVFLKSVGYKYCMKVDDNWLWVYE